MTAVSCHYSATGRQPGQAAPVSNPPAGSEAGVAFQSIVSQEHHAGLSSDESDSETLT
jgi:hypothetical protein